MVVKLFSEDYKYNDYAVMVKLKYDTYNDYTHLDDIVTSYSDWFIYGRIALKNDSLKDLNEIKRLIGDLFIP